MFDLAPEMLAVPWGYLALLIVAAAVSISAAVGSAQRAAARMIVENLREL